MDNIIGIFYAFGLLIVPPAALLYLIIEVMDGNDDSNMLFLVLGILSVFIIPPIFSLESKISIWFMANGITLILIFIITRLEASASNSGSAMGYIFLLYSILLSTISIYIKEYITDFNFMIVGVKIILVISIGISMYAFAMDFLEESNQSEYLNIKNTLRKVGDLIGVLVGILEIITETGKVIIKLLKIIGIL